MPLQDRPCLRAVAEGEIAGALYPSEPVGGEEAMGGIGSPHCLEMRLGGTKRSLTFPAVAEHGVALADVQERKTLQGMAPSRVGQRGCFLRQPQPCLRLLFAVQRDVALSQARICLRRRLARAVGGRDRLVVVADGSGMVPSLRCIPDELAHERGQLRLSDLQFAQDRAVGGLLAKERDLADALSGCRKQSARSRRQGRTAWQGTALARADEPPQPCPRCAGAA